MDRPGTKRLILLASQDGAVSGKADFDAARALRDKIDPAILRQVSTVLAPHAMGDRKSDRMDLVDCLLGSRQDYSRPFRPAIFNAEYIQSRLRNLAETQTAVLAVVPASQMAGITGSLVSDDGRRSALDIRTRARQAIAPGTGVVAVYEGPWSSFRPAAARIVQMSCPQTAECLTAPPVDDARRGAMLASALALIAAGSRRQPRL